MENDTQPPKPTEQANFVGAGLAILALVLLVWLVDVSALRVWVEKAGVWGPLVFILLKISTVVIAPLSGGPLYPLVGLIFGFWPGILYVLIGDFLGYTITFYISRIFGQKIVMKLLSNKEESLVARIVDHIGDAKGFFQACLTLFALPEVLSYGAGLSRLKYIKFISIIMPFCLVATSILVFFGSILKPNSSSLLISLALPVAGGIAIMIGGTLFMKSVSRKESNTPTF